MVLWEGTDAFFISISKLLCLITGVLQIPNILSLIDQLTDCSIMEWRVPGCERFCIWLKVFWELLVFSCWLDFGYPRVLQCQQVISLQHRRLTEVFLITNVFQCAYPQELMILECKDGTSHK